MSWSFRAAFIVAIALTVGWKLAASQRPRQADDIPHEIAAVLGDRSAGRITGQVWSPAISIYSAPVTGCAAPLIVATAPPDFSTTSILLQMQRPGDHHLFAYRDWRSSQPDRWTVLRDVIWQKTLSLAGLDRKINSDKMLFVAEPSGCTTAKTSPWRRFWTPGL